MALKVWALKMRFDSSEYAKLLPSERKLSTSWEQYHTLRWYVTAFIARHAIANVDLNSVIMFSSSLGCYCFPFQYKGIYISSEQRNNWYYQWFMFQALGCPALLYPTTNKFTGECRYLRNIPSAFIYFCREESFSFFLTLMSASTYSFTDSYQLKACILLY